MTTQDAVQEIAADIAQTPADLPSSPIASGTDVGDAAANGCLPDQVDCLIIGGGPAGMTAAIYLARYHRKILVIDNNKSRARWIPLSHNFPGYPDGVTGPGLLDRLWQQAAHYDIPVLNGLVEVLEKRGDGFVTTLGGDQAARTITAHNVLLATGVSDVGNQDGGWTAAIRRGAIRLCPICDAYEITGKRVGLIARGKQAARHALFLRTYTADLTLVRIDSADTPLPEQDRTALTAAGIDLIEDPAPALSIDQDDVVHITTSDGRPLHFDTVYPMFGCKPRSELASRLGAECDPDGNLTVDSHQSTSIAGLYAAGDLVSGLNQISVAVGHAAIAATAIHNRSAPRFA